MADAWQAVEGGLLLKIRLTPKADRDALNGMVEGADGPVVAARVRAVPEDGKANDALIRLVSKALGVSRSAVALERGATSRHKLLRVAGDAAALIDELKRLMGTTK